MVRLWAPMQSPVIHHFRVLVARELILIFQTVTVANSNKKKHAMENVIKPLKSSLLQLE